MQWWTQLDRLVALAPICALTAIAVGAAPASAEPTDWQIDPMRSWIALSIPDAEIIVPPNPPATIRIRNQVGQDDGPWDVGNQATLSGTIATDYVEGVSIEFLSGEHLVVGLVSGSYRPNPAVFDPLLANPANPDGQYADTSTAPAVFASRTRATTFAGTTQDGSFQSFDDVEFDVDSGGPLAITGGAFSSESLTLGISAWTIDFDGLFTPIGQPFPDQVSTPLASSIGANLAMGGSVTTPAANPQQRELTIPIDVDVVFDLVGIERDGSISGQIVAIAVPEPAPTPMQGVVAALLLGGACVRGRAARAARATAR